MSCQVYQNNAPPPPLPQSQGRPPVRKCGCNKGGKKCGSQGVVNLSIQTNVSEQPKKQNCPGLVQQTGGPSPPNNTFKKRPRKPCSDTAPKSQGCASAGGPNSGGSSSGSCPDSQKKLIGPIEIVNCTVETPAGGGCGGQKKVIGPLEAVNPSEDVCTCGDTSSESSSQCGGAGKGQPAFKCPPQTLPPPAPAPTPLSYYLTSPVFNKALAQQKDQGQPNKKPCGCSPKSSSTSGPTPLSYFLSSPAFNKSNEQGGKGQCGGKKILNGPMEIVNCPSLEPPAGNCNQSPPSSGGCGAQSQPPSGKCGGGGAQSQPPSGKCGGGGAQSHPPSGKCGGQSPPVSSSQSPKCSTPTNSNSPTQSVSAVPTPLSFYLTSPAFNKALAQQQKNDKKGGCNCPRHSGSVSPPTPLSYFLTSPSFNKANVQHKPGCPANKNNEKCGQKASPTPSQCGANSPKSQAPKCGASANKSQCGASANQSQGEGSANKSQCEGCASKSSSPKSSCGGSSTKSQSPKCGTPNSSERSTPVGSVHTPLSYYLTSPAFNKALAQEQENTPKKQNNFCSCPSNSDTIPAPSPLSYFLTSPAFNKAIAQKNAGDQCGNNAAESTCGDQSSTKKCVMGPVEVVQASDDVCQCPSSDDESSGSCGQKNQEQSQCTGSSSPSVRDIPILKTPSRRNAIEKYSSTTCGNKESTKCDGKKSEESVCTCSDEEKSPSKDCGGSEKKSNDAAGDADKFIEMVDVLYKKERKAACQELCEFKEKFAKCESDEKKILLMMLEKGVSFNAIRLQMDLMEAKEAAAKNEKAKKKIKDTGKKVKCQNAKDEKNVQISKSPPTIHAKPESPSSKCDSKDSQEHRKPQVPKQESQKCVSQVPKVESQQCSSEAPKQESQQCPSKYQKQELKQGASGISKEKPQQCVSQHSKKQSQCKHQNKKQSKNCSSQNPNQQSQHCSSQSSEEKCDCEEIAQSKPQSSTKQGQSDNIGCSSGEPQLKTTQMHVMTAIQQQQKSEKMQEKLVEQKKAGRRLLKKPCEPQQCDNCCSEIQSPRLERCKSVPQKIVCNQVSIPPINTLKKKCRKDPNVLLQQKPQLSLPGVTVQQVNQKKENDPTGQGQLLVQTEFTGGDKPVVLRYYTNSKFCPGK